MARKRSGRDLHAVFLLDKPAGESSNRALQKVRRLLHARKAGHTGSLDPFATGMLPICLGEASKTAAFMLDADKTYRAVARLGAATETGDTEGEVCERGPVPELGRVAIDKVLQSFTGPIDQIPPMYSALKHEGQPLYRLARRGVEVAREPRRVTIHRLECEHWDAPDLTFTVRCSKGTYIRTLAEDLGRAFGTCAFLVALRRLAVDPFPGEAMHTLEALESAVSDGREQALLLPPDAGLSAWPVACLEGASVERFLHGNPVPHPGAAGMARVHGQDGRVLGLGEVRPDGRLHPRRVFVPPTDGLANP
ncbi:tRNA pseudouridine(55) synthase TruB [Elongatibacter sediminis]|uniref:tRNA pseudouridine synthase B n=1 Tax=Elongatibacter sediminis TaxID=3119006 RepID=A0AAW9RHZ4_9GAMM